MEFFERNSSGKRNVKTVGNPAFLCIITAIISVCATLFAIYKINDGVIFVKNTKYGDLTKAYGVCEVIDNVDKNFYAYSGSAPTDEEMSVTAMKAIVESLDDKYAEYFTGEEYAQYLESVQNEFKGIGVYISEDDGGIRINRVFKNSPAERAGICAGDLIVAVDGTDVRGATLELASSLIGGEEGEPVVLDIMRGTELMQITAYYGDVHVPTVETKVLKENVGYLIISQFAEKTVTEFDDAVEKLTESGIESLVIDLRNNPGGYLDTVVRIADRIIDEGVIVYLGNTTDDPYLETYTAKKGKLDIPVVILVNENSASASEILAAAVKENKAGTIIGTTTYGKGIVQTTGKMYSTDGYLKFTTSAYYTPEKNDIHGIGVKPDIYSTLPEEYVSLIGSDYLPYEKDTQLQRAVEWLTEN